MTRLQTNQNILEMFLSEGHVGRNSAESLKDRLNRTIGSELRRSFSGKEDGHKLSAVGRHFEDALVQQVFEHHVAADVDDERDFRLQRRYIRKVLFRTNSEICAGRSSRSH